MGVTAGSLTPCRHPRGSKTQPATMHSSSRTDHVPAADEACALHAVFDYTYNRSEGPQIQKLVFFHW
jgi:hypothetical protein